MEICVDALPALVTVVMTFCADVLRCVVLVVSSDELDGDRELVWYIGPDDLLTLLYMLSNDFWFMALPVSAGCWGTFPNGLLLCWLDCLFEIGLETWFDP